MVLRSGSWSVVLVALVGCQFQASCGGKTLNMAKAKEFIATALEGDVGEPPTTVTCPAKVKLEQGTSFECTAEFGAARATLVLQQQDDAGFVRITAVSGIVVAKKIEAAIAAQLGSKLNAHFTVDCGARVRSSTPGAQFTCAAKDAKGASGPVTVIVKDAEGNVRFATGDAPPPEDEAPPAAGSAAPAAGEAAPADAP